MTLVRPDTLAGRSSTNFSRLIVPPVVAAAWVVAATASGGSCLNADRGYTRSGLLASNFASDGTWFLSAFQFTVPGNRRMRSTLCVESASTSCDSSQRVYRSTSSGGLSGPMANGLSSRHSAWYPFAESMMYVGGCTPSGSLSVSRWRMRSLPAIRGSLTRKSTSTCRKTTWEISSFVAFRGLPGRKVLT